MSTHQRDSKRPSDAEASHQRPDPVTKSSSRPILKRASASPDPSAEPGNDGARDIKASPRDKGTADHGKAVSISLPREQPLSPKSRPLPNKRFSSGYQHAAMTGKELSSTLLPGRLSLSSSTAAISRSESSSTTDSPSTTSSGAASAVSQPPSSDSSRTVRGAATPFNQPARTPSYPFPYVPGSPRAWSPAFHQPFTILSPTTSGGPSSTPSGTVISAASTPGATFSPFAPAGNAPLPPSDPRYPTPNLYDLVLQVSAEPGLQAWWSGLTEILHDSYLADRVSLAIPADANDIENVPWGQKATFNVLGHDENTDSFSSFSPVSVSDAGAFSTGLNPEVLSPVKPHVLKARPGLESRHSYSGVGILPKEPVVKQGDVKPPEVAIRPPMPTRAATQMPSSHHPNPPPHHARSSRLQESSAPSVSEPEFSSIGDDRRFIPHLSVFSVLRGLTDEPNELIDTSGVNRILERGAMVTLTRDYVHDQQHHVQTPKAAPQQARAATPRNAPSTAAQHSLPFRSVLIPAEDVASRRSSLYEEYEQQPPSPWSQSPAPSPAIQADPDDNPFFASIDSSADPVADSFDPSATTPDYSTLQAVEAIGVDKASTVIHIPLIHPTQSGILPPFEAGSQPQSAFGSPSQDRKKSANERRAPIAIISILSPAVPYPENLTHSLKMLAPHLAASLSNAQQFSLLQTQALEVMHRKAPALRNAGLGPLHLNSANLHQLAGHDLEDTAISDSITSPSDYSGRSRHSPSSSIVGTPGWDPSTQGHHSGRPSTDLLTGSAGEGDNSGYFDRRKGPVPRAGSDASINTPPVPATPYKGGSSRSSLLEHRSSIKKSAPEEDREAHRRKANLGVSDSSPARLFTGRERSPGQPSGDAVPTLANPNKQSPMAKNREFTERLHSVLHSYGADFSASFQSLPATIDPKNSANTRQPAQPRSAPEDEITQPSERLLRIIIDSLPVQIFTAAPGTGDLTWVNSKFLVYRGQDTRQVMKDPWSAIHPEDKAQYKEQWTKSLRTGQQLQQKVRLQRFDGNYRWFYVRAAPLKDKRQRIVHWIGTNMDFHEQHIAELNSARQQETAASEAKYRALANSSPQVVFTVNRTKGVTFCNSQWMHYSGQTEAQALSLGFVERVHPDDILKCRLPTFDEGSSEATNVPTSVPSGPSRSFSASQTSSSGSSETERGPTSPLNSPPSSQMPQRQLSELASTGILKVSRDADGKASYSTEVRLKSKDGEYRWFLVRVLLADKSLRIHDDEETWYGTCTDINDHKALERDLKETMDEKSRFLSNMSHEIRTPLNGITGMVNFLIDSNLSEEQMEHVNIIRASTEGLRGLINDILDLSKAEAGMIQLNADWMHVRSLIEEVNDLTSAMAVDKRLDLNYVVESNVPAQIKGDRFRIRQILLNVIGNAIKFTQVGEVFVRCSVLTGVEQTAKADEMLVQFEVVDTGRGFTEQEAQYLFKRFSQIDGSSTRQHGGTGLGLVISRQLAQLHGGDMSAKGYPGKGSTFVFYIKTALPTESDMPPAPIPTPMFQPVAPMKEVKTQVADSATMAYLTGKPLQGSPSSIASLPTVASAGSSVDMPRVFHSTSGSSADSEFSARASKMSLRSGSSSASSFVPDIIIPEQEPIKLKMPDDPAGHAEVVIPAPTPSGLKSPPMFSILVVCPLKYSREATVRHIEMTLPKHVPHQITARESLIECQRMIGGGQAVTFSHVVLSLHSVAEIVAFMDQLLTSGLHANTHLIVITDMQQRHKIMAAAPRFNYDLLSAEHKLKFIFKPLKPSKFGLIFDPQKEREMSTDRNQDSAQQVALTQKQLYDEMTKRLGNRGTRVLLVEDNRVNQMVLLKFLGKVSVTVETVLDGAQCTDKVFAKPHGYYSIILCDLHMPNKDGYQTCREIRKWEKENSYAYLPIIALSANVLGDVYAKCVEAGFNSYVTKPVDFKELSMVMLKYLDPRDPNRPIEFMRPKKK